MSADNFVTFSIARNPGDAFDKAVKEAQHWHGHGGYTGTIAEKDGFKFAGTVNGHHLEKLENYFWIVNQGGRLGQIPASIRPTILKFEEIWDEKWGPAVCFEVTGRPAIKIKKDAGRANTMDKVYVFLGFASS